MIFILFYGFYFKQKLQHFRNANAHLSKQKFCIDFTTDFTTVVLSTTVVQL